MGDLITMLAYSGTLSLTKRRGKLLTRKHYIDRPVLKNSGRMAIPLSEMSLSGQQLMLLVTSSKKSQETMRKRIMNTLIRSLARLRKKLLNIPPCRDALGSELDGSKGSTMTSTHRTK